MTDLTDAPLGAEALAHFEQRLLEERERALLEMGRFDDTFGVSMEESAGELSSYRFHMADLGTETTEQEKNHLLASHAGRLLWHIDDALPHARFCIDCKQRTERAKEFG